MNKREFLKGLIVFIPAGGLLGTLGRQAATEEARAPEASAWQAPGPTEAAAISVKSYETLLGPFPAAPLESVLSAFAKFHS